MLVATSEPRRCEVCGVPIRRNNKYGVCSDLTKPACEKARRLKREGRYGEQQKTCEICGKPLRLDNKSGICSERGTSECARVRRRINRGAADPKAHRYLIIIKPGDTFGLWTAIEEYRPKRKRVLCRCECGKEMSVRGARLVNGESRSCGCARYENRAPKEPYLAAGTVSGRLTVLEDVPTFRDRARCRCECGEEKTILAPSIKFRVTKSCGCLTRLHGFSKHPLYSTWASMIERCTNPNHNGYDSYSCLPVPVCDRWRDPWLFAEDILREIGPRPEARDPKGRVLYELDRIDNERGYGPATSAGWTGKDREPTSGR